jgi:hypothetical protein
VRHQSAGGWSDPWLMLAGCATRWWRAAVIVRWGGRADPGCCPPGALRVLWGSAAMVLFPATVYLLMYAFAWYAVTYTPRRSARSS